MDAGLGHLLFWGSLAFSLAVAGAVALPVNRWLIARGKGHAVVHATGIHGGPSPRIVGAIAVIAFIFGAAVLITEAFNSNAGHRDRADVAGRPMRSVAVRADGAAAVHRQTSRAFSLPDR